MSLLYHNLIGRQLQGTYSAGMEMVSLKATLGLPVTQGQLYSLFRRCRRGGWGGEKEREREGGEKERHREHSGSHLSL